MTASASNTERKPYSNSPQYTITHTAPHSLESIELVLLAGPEVGHLLAAVHHAHLARHLVGGAKHTLLHDPAVQSLRALYSVVMRWKRISVC